MLGAAIGGLTVASPLASPRQDHELLMAIAGQELIRCQDELAKLRQIAERDSQYIDQATKAMAARAAAIAEAQCQKLQQAIESAAQTAELPSRDNSGSRNAVGAPAGKDRQDAAPARAGNPPEAQASAPTLSVHFLAGSAAAAAKARTLAQQLGANFQRTDTKAETTAPAKTLVRYSDPADHKTAKSIGKFLASKGYTWRLEKPTAAQSGTASRTVDIWLPGDK